MTPPDLPGISAVDAVRKEVERTAVRARNGVRWFAGAEFAPQHPTRSDVVWRDGKASVRRYRAASLRSDAPAVCCFLGLVGQPYVFDLYKGGSIVEMLIERGFDTYVLDWGIPDEHDAANTLETYLGGFFPAALDAICREAGAESVNLFAYCMGGVMAVHALAAQPELPVKSLVTLASPFDWEHLGPYIDALRLGKIRPETVLDATGNVPASLIRQSFKTRKPTGDIVNYVNLWQNLWNDQYVEGYQAINRFLSDHIPFPGGVFRQVLTQWFEDNAFVTDRLRFDHRRITLADVRTPVLGVIADRDDIATEASTTPLARVLPNADVELLRIDAGHVSLFAGRQAVKEVMPAIFDWIQDRYEEAA
jgi:polyhydroxyalkanoate synthase subunit PhaC